MNIPADIEDDLVAIHNKLRKERQSHYYDDVYHAATYILVVPFVTYQRRVLSSEDPGSHPYIHRGQRNSDWLVAPNIMRLPRGETGIVSKDLVRARLRRTGAFVKRLRQKRLDLDERHAAAIAQHYSNAAKSHTWLIDMTSDPFVALWFASLGGEEGDLGNRGINLSCRVEQHCRYPRQSSWSGPASLSRQCTEARDRNNNTSRPDQAASFAHKIETLCDSASLASRIRFPTGTSARIRAAEKAIKVFNGEYGRLLDRDIGRPRARALGSLRRQSRERRADHVQSQLFWNLGQRTVGGAIVPAAWRPIELLDFFEMF
jgi:hypothetical protein